MDENKELIKAAQETAIAAMSLEMTRARIAENVIESIIVLSRQRLRI